MAEKCDTPTCLRGVDRVGQLCLPCQKGMRPMTNPKSPHAFDNPTKGVTTGFENPQKKLVIVHNGGNKPKTDPIIIKPTLKVSKSYNNWKKNKTTIEIKSLQKKAVKLIFSSYWYGWDDGFPDAFTEIFKEYGNFITGREVPSKMVGTPDVHTSHINTKGNAAFVLVTDFIYPIQGEASTFREIERSPIMREALGDVSPTDAIEMVKNNGMPFTFTKKDEKTYLWQDGNGIEREIPTWAIA